MAAQPGSLFVQTIEPTEVIMSPDEDCIVYFEDVQDDANNTPIDHTADLIQMALLDSDGNVVVTCSTAGDYMAIRPGTVNILDIVIPWSVTNTIQPGEYRAALVKVASATSREVLCDFVFQQIAP